MQGIGPWHLRRLAENPWNDGGGYTFEQVGRMTLDQIVARLLDLDSFKPGGKIERWTAEAAAAAVQAAPDGTIAGRAVDGTPIRGRIAGKSLARQLTEAKEAREKVEAEKVTTQQPRRRRRGGT